MDVAVVVDAVASHLAADIVAAMLHADAASLHTKLCGNPQVTDRRLMGDKKCQVRLASGVQHGGSGDFGQESRIQKMDWITAKDQRRDGY